ncbi:hypothetical protein D3C80_1316340 [compost metagenome]
MAAVIDALCTADALQGAVLQLRPTLPPVIDLAGRFHVQLAGLGPQPFGAKLARGQQQVSVMVAVVALLPWSMDGDINRDLVAVGDLAGEFQHEIPTQIRGQLDGQSDFKFAGHGRVLAGLCCLGRVPKRGPIRRP